MTRVHIDEDGLDVRLQGLHQLWAFTRQIHVPLAHVRGATADPGVFHEPKGLRAPGLHVPGLATIGTFHRDGQRHFWDVRRGDRIIVIELADEHYDRLVLEVDHARDVVDAINDAITRHAARHRPAHDG